MNIHPLIVHFPIALLTVYSILELIRSKTIVEKYNLLYTKALLLFVGILGGFFALQSGDMASEMIDRASRNNILRSHEMFAQITIILYSLLALGYVLKFSLNYLAKKNFKYLEIVEDLSIIILSPIVSIGVSIIALTTLSITGGLGGILVHGPDTDFITNILYKIFNV
jgi:uncharacterized membrane protein